MTAVSGRLAGQVRRALASPPFTRLELSSMIWAAFWLLVLTFGDPCLLEAIVEVVRSWAR